MSIQSDTLEIAKDLRHIITGNGNPEDGLVFRLKQLEMAVVNQTKKCILHAEKQVDDGSNRRISWWEKMPPSKKILVSIAILGFVFTYAIQIFHIAKGMYETFISMPT